MDENKIFCTNCGCPIEDQSTGVCPNCGTPILPPQDNNGNFDNTYNGYDNQNMYYDMPTNNPQPKKSNALAIIIAIVEGLTEFLPVSSTGHMIIAQNVLGVESTEFVKAFTVIIQFGAILSVVCLYWKRFFRLNHAPVPENTPAIKRFLHKFDFYWKLLVAFIPAAVLGFLLSLIHI